MRDEGQMPMVPTFGNHGAEQREPVAPRPVQVSGQRVAGAEVRGQRQGAGPASDQAAESQAELIVPRGSHQRGNKNCPCPVCYRSQLRAKREYRKKIKRGDPIWGDINAVRAHVEQLGEWGMGKRVIAIKAGLAPKTIGHLFYAFKDQSVTERVTHRVAQAILAVAYDVRAIARISPNSSVDSSGARRRLQALIVAGWTVQDLAAEVGLTRQHFRRFLFLSRYPASRCVRFFDLFSRLWMVRPPGVSARAEARRQWMVDQYGWVGIGAWDDDTIDDPSASPNTQGGKESIVDSVKVERVLAGHEKFTALRKEERTELVRRWVALDGTKTAFELRFKVSSQTSRKYFDVAVPDYQRKSA